MGCLLSLEKNSGTIGMSHFRIERVIGKGGFGKVNAAIKLRGSDRGAMYAIKQLVLKTALKNKKSANMLYNERNILVHLAALQHRRLANIHYAFFDPINCYVVLDLALGGDLLYQSGQQPNLYFTESSTKFYAAQMAEALIFLHQHHILHRDIKPENILLLPNGYIRLTDFGISTTVSQEKPFCTSRSGTKGFMAPEIYEGKHDQAADFFALGVTLFYLRTGKYPFLKLPPINWEECEHITPAFRALLLMLMEKDTEKRITDGQTFKNNAWFGNSIGSANFTPGMMDWIGLANNEIVPDFIPNILHANCNTGHHDATDALFGAKEQPPELSTDQSKSLKTPKYVHVEYNTFTCTQSTTNDLPPPLPLRPLPA